ncbi:MAG: hypothetical protein E7167_04420 [Firmicutes bacterium]|nr:hypothetical protein [Bacillota bacterium]
MNRVYLHSNNNVNSLNKLMLYLFIPFVMFGFYKNGIKLYLGEYVGLFTMFKPLILLGLSVIVSFLFSKLNKESFIGYPLLCNIIISMIISPSLPIIVFIVLLLLLNFLHKYFKFNYVPVFMLISIIVSLIINNYNFFNIFESSVEHSYSLFDYLLGKGYGGISNTFLIMSLLSLIILIMNINYKKQIPIMAFSVYYILAIITTFATQNIDQNLLLNNNVIFAFIFISNISIYTPYSRGACYIYGIILGLLTYVFYFIDINLGLYIVLTLLSFISPVIDRFIVGKNEKHLVDIL